MAVALPVAALGAASLLPGATTATPHTPAVAIRLHHATLAATSLPSATSPGAVAGFGGVTDLGSPGPTVAAPVVAMARTGSGRGYWLAAADGGVFSFGDATFHGSLGDVALHQPIVGMAATPDGGGYWLVAADGGVFSFGDATFHGSLGDVALHQPIVGMAATPDGGGYRLVAADGGVFSFGDATFHGSPAGSPLPSRVVGMAAPSTGGYWLAAADGAVYAFGDAATHGDLAGQTLARPVTAIAASPTGRGYWLAAADGGVFAFGDAFYSGSLSPEPVSTAVVALVPGLDDHSYWSATAPSPAPVTAPAATPTVAASTGVPLGAFTVTCYDLDGRTATGAPTSLNTVAVDPAVIPLGTTIDIAGVGTRVAQDTGGAVRGDHVDIWEPSGAACAEWGVQTRAVWRVG